MPFGRERCALVRLEHNELDNEHGEGDFAPAMNRANAAQDPLLT